MRHLAIGRWRGERGSTAVEFSLIGFTFIILLLGVVEMGRMVLVYTTIANAARAGARYAIVHGGERTATGVDGPSGPSSTQTTQVQTVVQNFASAGLLNTSSLVITVAYPDGTNTAGSHVTVTVTYPYDPLIPFFNSLLSKTLGSTSQGIITY
jgi:Flp pilus assembly protein TadG